MATTPAPSAGLPPGGPREQLLRAWAKLESLPDWRPTYRDDDDDDADGETIKARFNHNCQGEITETDLIVTTEEEWELRSESKDSAWSVLRHNGKVFAVAMLLTRGRSSPTSAPKVWDQREDKLPVVGSRDPSRAERAVMHLVHQALGGKLRGMTLKEISVPDPSGGEPVRTVMIDATNNLWEWFVGSQFYEADWTIIKQDSRRTQAVQIQV